MKIIMLGAPGTGKGTQIKKIAARYQIPHISTGDTLRANIKNGTRPGMKAKASVDAGGLAPDEIIIGMLLGRIYEADCQNGYVLDGFSRTIPQAESLTKTLGEMGESIDYAVNMDVSDENIVKRMSGRRACLACDTTHHIELNSSKKERIRDVCGQVPVLRDDDKLETVKKRLDVYHDRIQPLIEYYQKTGVLAQVDGIMGMEDVLQAIVKILGV